MFASIVTILFLTLIYILVGSLWYSKALFGKVFMKYTNCPSEEELKSPEVQKAIKQSYLKGTLVAVLKSTMIYLITYNTYYLLPEYFFLFALLITGIVVATMVDDVIWRTKRFGLYLINAGQVIVSTMLVFWAALIVMQF